MEDKILRDITIFNTQSQVWHLVCPLNGALPPMTHIKVVYDTRSLFIMGFEQLDPAEAHALLELKFNEFEMVKS